MSQTRAIIDLMRLNFLSVQGGMIMSFEILDKTASYQRQVHWATVVSAAKAGQRCDHGRTSSNREAMSNNSFSAPNRPTSCMPIGSPVDDGVTGMDMAGWPTAFTQVVKIDAVRGCAGRPSISAG